MKLFFQFSKYSSIAALSMLCDWAIFITLEFLGLNLIYAQMISRVGGGVFSFFANRYWGFRHGKLGQITQHGRRFLVLYAFSFSLSILLIYSFMEILDLPPFISKFMADSLCFVFNFAVMRNYVFKDRQGFSSMLKMLMRSIVKTT
jgi:putative flippase GtrA